MAGILNLNKLNCKVTADYIKCLIVKLFADEISKDGVIDLDEKQKLFKLINALDIPQNLVRTILAESRLESINNIRPGRFDEAAYYNKIKLLLSASMQDLEIKSLCLEISKIINNYSLDPSKKNQS